MGLSKRTAGSKSSAAKRAKVTLTPLEKHTTTVMSALENEETVVPGPASCRAMLVTAVPAALKVPKDERHENQYAVIRMVREIFDNEKARWESRVADSNNALENATATRAENMGVKDAADAELKTQKDEVKAKLEAQSKAQEVVDDCKDEHAASIKLLKKADTKKDKLVKTQSEDLSLEDTFNRLKEGVYENPKEVKSHISAVIALIEGLGAEEALTKSLPQVLRRKPEERGSFDEMALQQVDVYMSNHLTSLSSKIEDAVKIVDEQTVAVTAWEAAVEVAEDKKSESDAALDAATAKQEQLQEALNAARKIVKEQTAVVKSRGGDVATEECGLYAVEAVLESLDFLEEYVIPEPEVETKEPEQVVEEVASFTESVEAITTELPEEAFVDVVIPVTKAKQMDVAMPFDDVPSPSKKARHAPAPDSFMVVA
jgi:hypothetical protein